MSEAAKTEALVDTHGQLLTDRDIRRGMRTNILAGCIGMMWAAVAGGMPMTMFMDRIGASGVLIGLSVAVQQVATLMQVPAALFSEMLSARKLYWFVLSLLHRVLWFVPAMLPFALRDPTQMAFVLVLALGISAVLAQAATPAWWSWMQDLIPERWRSGFWGQRQGIVFIAYLVAMGLAGWALDAVPGGSGPGASYAGFSLVFGIAAVLGCADIVVHYWVPEPRSTPIRLDLHVLRRILAPLRERDFQMLTWSLSIWGLAAGIVSSFGLLYLKRDLGVNYTALSFTVISGAVGTAVAGFLWGYVMDRIGARNFGVIMMILGQACGLVWFFMQPTTVTLPIPFMPNPVLPQSVLLLLIANFIAGAFYSGVGLAQISLLGALTTREGRTMAMAVHWAIVGTAGALGPLVGGWIMDWLGARPIAWVMPTGARFAFIHVLVLLQMLIGGLLAVPLLGRVRRRAGEMAFRAAVSRFVVLNPLRIASSIMNIFAMGMATSRRDHAHAVRKLGEGRTAIAVSDLIQRLEDPALDVREEAVMALGAIGSPDAVDALLVKLADPLADLAPEIARALRQARNPKAVPALLGRLPGADRETASQIARTLGELGDRRAAGALLKLLQETQDSKIVSACSEALARLGEFSAVYELLPRMKTAQNTQLNLTLLVNVGDLLGPPGGFYSVLIREQRARGTEVERLLQDMTRAVQHVAGRRQRADTHGRHALELIAQLDRAFAEGRIADCVRAMFDLGAELSQIEFGIGHPGEDPAFIETLVCHDERFGVGMWFLDILRHENRAQSFGPAEETDVLLGIYFLSAWAKKYA